MKNILFLIFLSVPALVKAEATVNLSSEGRQAVLIELYTSQGCSSCPPAERWLNRFAEDEKLWSEYIPMAFHVDYWDYLGWKDPYASSTYSERQRNYGRQGYLSSVYTPGILVNGEEWRGRTQIKPLQLSTKALTVSIDENTATINYGEQKVLQAHVALLGFDIQTKVTRGENSDKNLKSNFVVLSKHSDISNNGEWKIKLPESDKRAGRYGIAVWINRLGNQKPLQAVGGWLPERNPQ